jgi:heterodisulfide reductase subunit A
MGLAVFVIEKEPEIGGWTGKLGEMFPSNRKGEDLIKALSDEVHRRESITVFTSAKLIRKEGTVGDFSVVIEVAGKDEISLNVGAIIVATGFSNYQPMPGEFGYGQKGVVTLPEFKERLDKSNGSLTYDGRAIRDIAYIYCVGSRQARTLENPNLYCSRYCCTATVHTALRIHTRDKTIHQYHLYRDMRTYGKYELLFTEALDNGSIFMKYGDDDPPTVESRDGRVHITVRDHLTQGEELELDVDLLVLVSGMVPSDNRQLVDTLKLPIGRDGFYNEIHPKLRPVETVIDGVFIAGASQGPKTLAESVASSLAAASKSAALLMKGFVDLEPLIAKINPSLCIWCDECTSACPYDAIEKVSTGEKDVARVLPALCKGGGACVPVCPKGAIDVEGYTDAQITTMIDALVREV